MAQALERKWVTVKGVDYLVTVYPDTYCTDHPCGD